MVALCFVVAGSLGASVVLLTEGPSTTFESGTILLQIDRRFYPKAPGRFDLVQPCLYFVSYGATYRCLIASVPLRL